MDTDDLNTFKAPLNKCVMSKGLKSDQMMVGMQSCGCNHLSIYRITLRIAHAHYSYVCEKIVSCGLF